MVLPELQSQYIGHVALAELGMAAQEAWLKARVLVVGVGGLGCAVAQGLAMAGVGHLSLADDDVVQPSNLPRQCLFGPADVGRLKVEAAADALRRLQSQCALRLVPEALAGEKLLHELALVDLVVDATDRPRSRQEVNEGSQRSAKALVFGSAMGWDGQVALFDPQMAQSPCLHCLYPQGMGEAESCGLRGVFSPLVQVVGAMQVAESLCYLAGIHHDRVGQLTLIDMKGPRWMQLAIPPKADCPACALRKGHA